jgi:hypothetical protein
VGDRAFVPFFGQKCFVHSKYYTSSDDRSRLLFSSLIRIYRYTTDERSTFLDPISKLRAPTNSEPLIFFPLRIVTVPANSPYNSLSQPNTNPLSTTRPQTPPTTNPFKTSKPLATTAARATPNRKDETPHPQLPHLRPQSLQTRTRCFPSTPPRRRTRTRRTRSESRVFGQCVA